MPDVFPRRNLPGDSEPWGRGVDSRLKGWRSSFSALSQKTLNGLRAVANQLSVISLRVNELYARQTQVQSVAQVSRTTSTTPSISLVSNIDFNRPGSPNYEGRRALVTVSGLTTGSTLSSSFTTYVELRDSMGNSLWRAETFVGSGASAPPDWTNAAQVFGIAVVDLPAGTSVDTFALYFGGKLDFGAGGSVTLSEITVTISYSGVI